MTTAKIIINIFSFLFITIGFNASTSANIDDIILSAYKSMYGSIKDTRDHHDVWNNLMLKFPEMRASLYAKCFIEAKGKFIFHKDHISGYVNEYDDLQFFSVNGSKSRHKFFTKSYGDQKVYLEMMFFGVLLVESCLEIEKYTENSYKSILFMLAFHRQMMAQYMNVNFSDNHLFGYVGMDTETKSIIAPKLRTQLCFQFPEACALIHDKMKINHNQFISDEAPFDTPIGVTFTSENIHIKKLSFKHCDDTWYLSRIYIPKEIGEKQVLSCDDSDWLMIPVNLMDELALESVIILHGEGLAPDTSESAVPTTDTTLETTEMLQATHLGSKLHHIPKASSKVCELEKDRGATFFTGQKIKDKAETSAPELKKIACISKDLFESLPCISDKIKKIEIIAKISFLESHMTFIRLGGGSLVEMFIEGLLKFNNLPSYLYQTKDKYPRMSLWSKAICYPNSDIFIDEMRKVLSEELLNNRFKQ